MRHLPQEIIRRKRDGARLAASEIEAFVAGLTAGHVSEGQAAAFAMAVLFRGLAGEERVALTHAMARSGTVLAWDLPGPVLDKHSTGGIGDTGSLALAPAVAACGGFVPMISGRGSATRAARSTSSTPFRATARSPISTRSGAWCARPAARS